jgi:hypothetical protein
MVEQPVSTPLPAHRTAYTQNKSTQISMPQFGLEQTIHGFQRAKIVHDLDCETTVIGINGTTTTTLTLSSRI